MVSLNIDNHSKTLAFKKFKHRLYKYPKFVKIFKKHPNKFLLFYICSRYEKSLEH